jgi:diacylglycerol kinase (ATP)
MKNLPFRRRLAFAVAGLKVAFESERSLRVHSAAASGALVLLVLLRPDPIWWAVVTLCIAAVVAAELINTAIEHLADHLHPDEHPAIRCVKDCAAAAVLVTSLGALAVAATVAYALIR